MAKRTANTNREFSARSLAKAKKFGDVTGNGVAFVWELAGSAGASFALIREPHHTDAEIEAAADWIASRRDVVGKIYVGTVSTRTLPLMDGGVARIEDEVIHPVHGQVTLFWDSDDGKWVYYGSMRVGNEVVRGYDVEDLLLCHKVSPALLELEADDQSHGAAFIREWGAIAFADQEPAWSYAKALEGGEGGLWRAELIGKCWRAHRVASYREPTFSEWDEAAAYLYREIHESGSDSLAAEAGEVSVSAVSRRFASPAAAREWIDEQIAARKGCADSPRG